ncbi:hypothetical protein BC937DRAFT_88099 [Endogone sp. FLAS-F59071]|nr:hypothetical protein BC937DRAFT_88099 [Endogone sp. FLAS-F59071]|eukprot:RUS22650.1 hypothetical protein BC937DRAFT_88099 [Endogone sp. FLAS-F59071]
MKCPFEIKACKPQIEPLSIPSGVSAVPCTALTNTTTWVFAHPTGWVPFDNNSQAILEGLWENGWGFGWIEGDSHFGQKKALVNLEQGYVEYNNIQWPICRTLI